MLTAADPNSAGASTGAAEAPGDGGQTQQLDGKSLPWRGVPGTLVGAPQFLQGLPPGVLQHVPETARRYASLNVYFVCFRVHFKPAPSRL